MKIKKGDLVKVITGSQARRGQVGKVVEVIAEKNRVRVEGIGITKRHLKPQKDPKRPEGGIVDVLGSIHVSNVMLMSEALGRPVRTGSSFMDDGKKVRVARGRGLKSELV